MTIAGWSGGYGKMVEIDHGNGLATRYGHLSQIDVSVGDEVRIGQVIGRIGSTGRSTGPHLHYETRVDGEPVNPQKFLDAGAKLFGDGQHSPQRPCLRRTSPSIPRPRRASGPVPNAFCASAASMNWSMSPSSTPPVLEVETPVRRSFTI